MQMQKLGTPCRRRILRPLQILPLLRITLIALGREAVLCTGEILVIVGDPECRDRGITVLLQFRGEHRIVFWGDDLHGDSDIGDLFFSQDGRVGG